MSTMTKDWLTLTTIVCITIALSVMTTLVIIDQEEEQPHKVVVMDFARDLAMMVKDRKINEENQQSILADMIRQSESFAHQGYLVLNKTAVLASPDNHDYRYYESK